MVLMCAEHPFLLASYTHQSSWKSLRLEISGSLEKFHSDFARTNFRKLIAIRFLGSDDCYTVIVSLSLRLLSILSTRFDFFGQKSPRKANFIEYSRYSDSDSIGCFCIIKDSIDNFLSTVGYFYDWSFLKTLLSWKLPAEILLLSLNRPFVLVEDTSITICWDKFLLSDLY